MIIRPDNRYTRRFNRLTRIVPWTLFLLFGGWLLLSTGISALANPGSETGWAGTLITVAVTGFLCFLLSKAMSGRGFSKLLNRISTRLNRESVIFENPYFGSVELGWDDVEDIRLGEEKGAEGLYFRLKEGSDSLEGNTPLLLRGRELEQAGGYHWRLTPDLYDRPAAGMLALFTNYWQNPAAREELPARNSEKEVKPGIVKNDPA
jgi:hypothetical protein